MHVLVGEGTGGFQPMIERLGWGRMWIARTRNIYTYPGELWGLDNGAFMDWRNGVGFDEVAYMKTIEKALSVPDKPYLAVLPDIVAGGHESLQLSDQWMPKMPQEWPLYLAVQDGVGTQDVGGFLGKIVGVFLGGTNKYKSRARPWCEWAHNNGLRFHYGRAGTLNKVAHAREVGADSLDSAFPLWTKHRMGLFVEQVTNGPIQRDLFWEAT